MRDVSLENSVAILGSDVLHTAREVFPSMDENHIYGWVRVLIRAFYAWIARFDPQVTSTIYGFQPAYAVCFCREADSSGP